MREEIEEILIRVCGTKEVLDNNVDLLDSGLLDSLAMIDLLFELEDLGIQIQPAQVERTRFRTVQSICELAEEIKAQSSAHW